MSDQERSLYSQQLLRQLSAIFMVSSIGCFFLLTLRIALTNSYRYSFLIWNLFLAWIPYIISNVMNFVYRKVHSEQRLRISMVTIGFVWLLFYPNAPYILTDFIHVIRVPPSINQNHTILTNNAILWYDIVLNSSFAFIGHLIGLISLVICHNLFRKTFKKYSGWIFVTIASLVGGYGIYLGRFVRLNSWNILTKPLQTIKTIIVDLFNTKAVLFSLCFGFFIFLTYLIVYSFHKLKQSDENR
ncbi:MAG: DUF1361 domain-containing protein [Candidatus Cloacimonadota bacterium]|nr:MAG: DUF1361 domain-containing protein [Candidatus Cloacimonadota bacterium]